MHSSTPTTAETVLDAAARLFAEYGYPNAPVDQLAAAAGVTKPTVYYHFGSKAGLFQAVLDRALDRVYARLKDAYDREERIEERLTGLIEELFVFTCAETDAVRIAFYAAFTTPKELPEEVRRMDKNARNFELIHRAFVEAQSHGEFAGKDAMELALNIYGQAVIHIMSYLFAAERPLDRSLAERTVALFLDGART